MLLGILDEGRNYNFMLANSLPNHSVGIVKNYAEYKSTPRLFNPTG